MREKAKMAESESTFGPVLVGMRGSGKSSVAPLLAARLNMTAIDADHEFEARHGRKIAEVFAKEGEEHFRDLERSLLLDLLDLPQIVLATGGGAVLHPEFRGKLGGRFTIWLHAPLPLLAQRIDGSDRPSLTEDAGLRELEIVLEKRKTLYQHVATQTINADQPLPQIVDTIAARWHDWLNWRNER
jgi:shikimate kinase